MLASFICEEPVLLAIIIFIYFFVLILLSAKDQSQGTILANMCFITEIHPYPTLSKASIMIGYHLHPPKCNEHYDSSVCESLV